MFENHVRATSHRLPFPFCQFQSALPCHPWARDRLHKRVQGVVAVSSARRARDSWHILLIHQTVIQHPCCTVQREMGMCSPSFLPPPSNLHTGGKGSVVNRELWHFPGKVKNGSYKVLFEGSVCAHVPTNSDLSKYILHPGPLGHSQC